MRALGLAIAVVLTCAAPARADGGTSTARHLLAGVRAFQAEHYEEALVELRLVARAPDAPPDLAFYLGPTLVKLGRHREALQVFLRSPVARDTLSDFYLGEAYYQLKLYRKARAVFAGLRAHGLGPALDEAAAKFVAAVDDVYRTAPAPATIDYYLQQGGEDKDAAIGAEYLDEAWRVEALAPARYRHAEIAGALAAAWNATGHADRVVAALARERGAAGELAWQIARAYVATGDPARARGILDEIVKARGAHAAEATTLLGTLPP